MNERVKELLKQSELQPYYDAQEKHIEKFAELIIRECSRIDSEENNPDHIDGETYNYTILNHFGVKR